MRYRARLVFVQARYKCSIVLHCFVTATLPPRGILEIGPELLMTPFWNPLLFVAALVNKRVPWCAWLLSSALAVLRLRLLLSEALPIRSVSSMGCRDPFLKT